MAQVPEGLAGLGIEEVHVVRLQPGDVIVLCTPKRLSMVDCEELRDWAQEFFDGHRVTVLEDGVTLEVLRKDGAP